MGGMDTMSYAVLVAVEEGLEMFGVVLFIYALLSYIGQQEMADSLLRMHQNFFARSGSGGQASKAPARKSGQSRRNRPVQPVSRSAG
jgi:hypothetical protein